MNASSSHLDDRVGRPGSEANRGDPEPIGQLPFLDRFLQELRIAQAIRWIEPGSHVLDVGCFDGSLFWQAPQVVKSGVGIDVVRPHRWPAGPYEFRLGGFPEVIRENEIFDCVVMLAVVEHVPDDQLTGWSKAVSGLVRPGGRVVITTPSPVVDRILDAGIRLKALKGMEAGQHHGFDPRRVPSIFGSESLRLRHQRRFELGLNYLFVFDRAT